MKKVLALVVGMLLIPFTAFGMQVMTDSDMDNVTGQSGVAISVNDILIYNQGGDQIWYQNLNVWNTIDNRMHGPAAIGLVFGTEAYSLTYINGLFWTERAHLYGGSGYGLGDNDTAFGSDHDLTPIGSRGRFGLQGDYNAVNWNDYDTGGWTTWKAGFEYAALGGVNFIEGDDSVSTLADVLTPRPFMISVQNNLFGDIHEFYDFDGGADGGIATVVIELGTVEIYNTGSEYFDIFISELDNPTEGDYTTIQAQASSLGRIYRVDGGVTAYLSGDIAITSRGLLYKDKYVP